MNWFRRRAAQANENPVAAAVTDIGAMRAANDLYLMAQLHPDLRTAGKRASHPSFLIGRHGVLYRVTVEAVR